jgi:ribosomal protein S18 acetylase RimI-like enzyme
MPTVTSESNPYQLYADELTEDDRAELIHLNCGDEAWSRAATEWMLGSEVWESIAKHKTKVWLYRNDADVIIGFGSLGISRRRWPPPDGGYANILIIPMLGIDHRFHGKPPNPDKRYSNQIISHLRHEAIQLIESHQQSERTTLPLLSLFVHRDNHRAIRLYEKFGFVAEPSAGRENLLLMVQNLKSDDAS